jgi:hypothetical protein
MKVVFNTNIDHYKTNCFPTNLTQVPRIGEKVLVNEVFGKYYADKKLPLRLEVIDVLWCEAGAIVELHYCEIDVKIANQNGVNLF